MQTLPLKNITEMDSSQYIQLGELDLWLSSTKTKTPGKKGSARENPKPELSKTLNYPKPASTLIGTGPTGDSLRILSDSPNWNWF